MTRRFQALLLACAVGSSACDDAGSDDGGDDGIDLARAIEIAQDDLPEGVPWDAERVELGGVAAFDIDIELDEESHEIYVDAESGEILDRLIDPDDFLDAVESAEALVGSDFALVDAVEIAGELVEGDAVAAELDDTRTVVRVVISTDAAETRVVRVSLADGSATVD